jgi:hypothetical protein
MTKISYSGYHFPPEIIQQAIWLYVRFTFRDVEDLLAERGILVSYETVRRWVNYFEPRSLPIFADEGQCPALRPRSGQALSGARSGTHFPCGFFWSVYFEKKFCADSRQGTANQITFRKTRV